MLKEFSLLQSVHFNCSVVSDCVKPHGLQHTRIPCPSPNPRACWNSNPMESPMPFKHLILSHPLLLGLHSFLASGSFPMRQFFASGGKSTGVAASASVLLVNNQADTTRPLSGGCMGTGGTRGATPHSRSGVVAVRRYTSSKVNSSGCALLEQPWTDNPRPS